MKEVLGWVDAFVKVSALLEKLPPVKLLKNSLPEENCSPLQALGKYTLENTLWEIYSLENIAWKNLLIHISRMTNLLREETHSPLPTSAFLPPIPPSRSDPESKYSR